MNVGVGVMVKKLQEALAWCDERTKYICVSVVCGKLCVVSNGVHVQIV